ncbi:MAG: GAP family protein [Methanobacterium sp.]
MSDFSNLLITILPIAFGAAVSPTVLIGIILVLSISKNPKLNGIAFYVGSIVLLLIVVALGVFVSKGAVIATGGQPSITSAYFDTILGILLILFGIRRIRTDDKGPNKKRFAGEESKSTLSEFIKYMILGFLMFVINFTTTILVFAAGKDIGLSPVPLVDKLIVIVILTIIALIVVEVPLLVEFLFPKTANRLLEPVNKWMQKNGKYLMAAIIFIFGIYLLWKGLMVLI